VRQQNTNNVSMNLKNDEPLTSDYFLMGSAGELPPLAHYINEHETVSQNSGAWHSS
jgi:hypothetical protein